MLPRNFLILLCCFLAIAGYSFLNNHPKTRADQLFEDLANAGIQFPEDIDREILRPIDTWSFGLELPALSDFDEVIRLREDDSWKTFDYICSVYNGNPPRIQLVIQEMWDGKDPPGYIIKERVLTRQEYGAIWEKLLVDSIHTMPYDLEPKSTQTWGYYYIAIKSNNFLKTVTWQDDDIETFQKEKALTFYYDLFKYAGLPNPQGVVTFVGMNKDSAFFKASADTFKFIRKASIQFKDQNQDIVWDTNDDWNLAVPLKDTLEVQQHLSFQTIMDNGDTLHLKNIRWIDLRKNNDI